MTQEGRKDDSGKLRFDLIPPYPLEELARVYTIGANKYQDRNWEKGIKWGRIFAAMMRHAWAFWRGESYDPKDGQHHLSSVAWCAFALLEFERTKTGEDDRSPLALGGSNTGPGLSTQHEAPYDKGPELCIGRETHSDAFTLSHSDYPLDTEDRLIPRFPDRSNS